MASLKDVAVHAGVSVSTASLALREDPAVKELTRQRIRRVADELGYRPNGIARDLKVKKTDMIAVLLHDLGGPFYSELLRGVQDRSHQRGFTAIVACSAKGKSSAMTRLLRENRVAGAIVLDPVIDESEISSAASEDLPIVVLDRDIHAPHVYAVSADHEGGAYKATRHLLDNGYRRIGFLGGPEDSFHSRMRFDGYRRALVEAGVAFDGDLVCYGLFTEDSGYDAGFRMFAKGRHPDAVFAANDEMAIGLLRSLEEQGLRVPGDVALVGFDDIRLTQYVSPALTTVRQPMYQLGSDAVEQLFQIMSGHAKVDSVTLSTELVIRHSSGVTPRSPIRG